MQQGSTFCQHLPTICHTATPVDLTSAERRVGDARSACGFRGIHPIWRMGWFPHPGRLHPHPRRLRSFFPIVIGISMTMGQVLAWPIYLLGDREAGWTGARGLRRRTVYRVGGPICWPVES